MLSNGCGRLNEEEDVTLLLRAGRGSLTLISSGVGRLITGAHPVSSANSETIESGRKKRNKISPLQMISCPNGKRHLVIGT
jgi:hypothetical protein